PHLDAGDDVVRTGDAVRGDDALDASDLGGDLRPHPHPGLHEDVAAKHRTSRAHHTRLRGDQGSAGGRPTSRTSVDPFRYSTFVPSIVAIVASTSEGMPRSPAQRLSSVLRWIRADAAIAERDTSRSTISVASRSPVTRRCSL